MQYIPPLDYVIMVRKLPRLLKIYYTDVSFGFFARYPPSEPTLPAHRPKKTLFRRWRYWK